MTCCKRMSDLIFNQPRPADWRFCPFCGLTTSSPNEALDPWEEFTDDGEEQILSAHFSCGAFEAHIDRLSVGICFDSTIEKELDMKIAFSVLMLLKAHQPIPPKEEEPSTTKGH